MLWQADTPGIQVAAGTWLTSEVVLNGTLWGLSQAQLQDMHCSTSWRNTGSLHSHLAARQSCQTTSGCGSQSVDKDDDARTQHSTPQLQVAVVARARAVLVQAGQQVGGV